MVQYSSMNHLRFRHLRGFTVVIEADEAGGYYAMCPTLPGCYSQGESLQETTRNIKQAVQCHLDSLATAR